MPLDRRAVEAALLTKGFRPREGRHRRFIYYTGDGLLRAMARQCKLTRREFDDLIACPLSRDQYEAKLLELDVI